MINSLRKLIKNLLKSTFIEKLEVFPSAACMHLRFQQVYNMSKLIRNLTEKKLIILQSTV